MEIACIPTVGRVCQNGSLCVQAELAGSRFYIGGERNYIHTGSIALTGENVQKYCLLWYNPGASERKHILPGTGIKRP